MMDLEDEKRISKMIFNNVVDALEQVVLPRFDSLEKRMGNVENRLEGVEGRLTGVEGRLTGVEGRLTGVEGRLTGVEKSVDLLSEEMGGVKMRLVVVEKKLDGLIDTSLIVSNDEKRIRKLEKAVSI